MSELLFIFFLLFHVAAASYAPKPGDIQDAEFFEAQENDDRQHDKNYPGVLVPGSAGRA